MIILQIATWIFICLLIDQNENTHLDSLEMGNKK
jgi:hypothetical protein